MGTFLFLTEAVVSRLTPDFLHILAKIISFILFSILRLRRSIAVKNIRIAYGNTKSEEEILNIARKSYHHFVLTILELLASRRQDISKNVDIIGRHHITTALSEKKGIYVICCHMGSWEAMGSAFTRFVVPAHVLVKKVGGGSMNRLVESLRKHNDFLTIKRQKKGDGFEAIKQVLADNHAVGFVMDQARPGEPRLPFFGKPAKTNTSLAAIWRKIPAPIIPVYLTRNADGSKIMKIPPALNMQTTDDAAKDILDHSLLFNQTLESIIKECPEQYFWMHDRWK